MAEEVKDVNVDEKKESAIDLDKLNRQKEGSEEPKDELAVLKAELERERQEKAEALDKMKKFKDSFDKKASEVAKLTKVTRELEKTKDEPVERVSELEQIIADYDFKDKKNEVASLLMEQTGLNKKMTDKLIASTYNDDTKEINVGGDFVVAFAEILAEVIVEAEERAYLKRDAEIASGKPRSIGKNENLDIAEAKRQEWLKKNKRKR